MSVFSYEFRHSVRSLYKSRGFIFVVVVTLGVALAANTIVFSVLNAVLLRPLPFPGPDQLVTAHWLQADGRGQGDISAASYFMLQNEAQSFESITTVYPAQLGVNLSGMGPAEYVKALWVFRNFTHVLGVSPLLGRDFLPQETEPNGPRSVLLSYRIWRDNFRSDPAVVNRTIEVNGQEYTIIGVMPPDFRSYPDADVWLSLHMNAATANPGNDYRVIGRLQNGLSSRDAREEVRNLLARHPEISRSQSGGTLVIERFKDALSARMRNNLVLLFLALVFVLMIACTNVAGLLLVRTSARTREIAVRAALGCSWMQFMKMFFIESMVLTLLGGLVGVISAKELLPFVLSFAPAEFSSMHVVIDGRVLLFTASICALVFLVLGLLPAFKLRFATLNDMLQQTSRDMGISISQTRTGRVLVVLQSGLTLVLLAGTTIVLANFVRLLRVQPGFDSRHVLVAQVTLAESKFQTTSSQQQFLDNFFEKIRDLPEVDAVGSISTIPLEKGLNLPIYPADASSRIEPAVEYRIISPDYFKVMHIPLVAGRAFSPSDTAAAPPVAIINETLARRWWPQASSLDRFVGTSDLFGRKFSDVPRALVGIVADVRDSGLDLPPSPTIFVPLTQAADGITSFNSKLFLTSIVIRTSKDSDADIADLIRGRLQSVDPDLPLATLRPLTEIAANSLARPRFYTLLLSTFGTLALFLTSMGVYGLLSYQLGLRTREVAIRMAVGARRGEVATWVIRRGLALVMIGATLGLFGALLLRSVLRPMVYNVFWVDIGSVVSSILLLGLTAVLSSLLTAIRAASIDPMAALRSE